MDIALKFQSACTNTIQKFGFEQFKEEKRLALKKLILGRDAFVILPTCSGKSLTLQAFPLVVSDYTGGTLNAGVQVIVVVISPLLSLKGHSQLVHLRIRYHFLANLHITLHHIICERRRK